MELRSEIKVFYLRRWLWWVLEMEALFLRNNIVTIFYLYRTEYIQFS